MIPKYDVVVLQEQIRRTGRSLLQYATESIPWSRKPEDRAIFENILEMAKDEQVHIQDITKYLRENRQIVPHMGAHPMHFMNMNFLAVKRLVDLIIQHHQAEVAHLETVNADVTTPEVKDLLERLAVSKRKHIQQLQEWLAPPAPQADDDDTQITTPSGIQE